ncbi:MAG TPA: sulfite exporter TauE/SafE family protein [Dokdonella sp.]|nr:sulfite exporter TauE/SafE family protein [Dokdonella sp.]
MIVTLLLAALAVLALAYLGVLVATARRRGALAPNAEAIALGATTNFLDTLGIGSFAPTTAWLKLRRLVPDSHLPATLNSGHALPTIVQALIFIHLVRVDARLLAACIAAAVVGATFGARLVVRLPVRSVQAIVGVAMLVAALLYASANLGWLPAGGDALALDGPRFAIAVAAHVLLGALMTFGIGLYAPSLILLSLFGLDPIAAFPVMMGACAFLMPVAGARFVRSDRIDLRVVLGLALGGIPAVLLAAWVVRSLPLTALRWGVVVVVLYAAALLLRPALTAPEKPLAEVPIDRRG